VSSGSASKTPTSRGATGERPNLGNGRSGRDVCWRRRGRATRWTATRQHQVDRHCRRGTAWPGQRADPARRGGGRLRGFARTVRQGSGRAWEHAADRRLARVCPDSQGDPNDTAELFRGSTGRSPTSRLGSRARTTASLPSNRPTISTSSSSASTAVAPRWPPCSRCAGRHRSTPLGPPRFCTWVSQPDRQKPAYSAYARTCAEDARIRTRTPCTARRSAVLRPALR